MSYTWNENYCALKEYATRYGTTRLKQSEKYAGYSLGTFVRKCRTDYNSGCLSDERIALLKEIGFVFDPYEEDWIMGYEVAKAFYSEFNHLLVPQRSWYRGFKLGQWISRQRSAFNKKSRKITDERKNKLDAIGMIWNVNDESWELHYQYAEKYYEQYGNLDVLVKYEIDGIKLGRWISNQRTARKFENDSHIMTADRIKRLDDIGMIWEYANTKQASFPEKAMFFYFKKIFPNAIANDRSFGCEIDALDLESKIGMEYDGAYYHKNPEKDIDHNRMLLNKVNLYRFREKGCPKLGDGLSHEIKVMKVDNYGYLSEVYQKAFDDLCNELEKPKIDVDIYKDLEEIIKLYKSSTDRFEFWYKEARAYYKEHGNLMIIVTDERTKRLANFIGRCRAAYSGRKGKITKDQIRRLETLNMVWNVPEEQFANSIAAVEKYCRNYGELNHISTDVVIDGVNIKNFILAMRRTYKEGRLSKEIITRLEKLGMVWNPKQTQWETYYLVLKKIYEREGNIDINNSYEEEGLKVGRWLYHQVLAYWKIEDRYIDEERIKLLEELHIDWRPELYKDGIPMLKEKMWLDKYALVAEFIEREGVESLNVRTCYKEENIGTWLSKQRSNDNLSQQKKDLLKGLGLKLNLFEEDWMEMFYLVEEFVGKYGWYELHEKTVYKGKSIGRWIDTRRQERKGKRGDTKALTKEKIELLDSIGMIWDVNLYKWYQYYDALKEWLSTHSWKELSNKVNFMNLDIGKWIIRQRRIRNGASKTGRLTDEQIVLLEEIGIEWDVADARWKRMFSLVKNFVLFYGWDELNCNTEYMEEKIGAWIERQRGARKGKCGRLTISQERINMLDSIGMRW